MSASAASGDPFAALKRRVVGYYEDRLREHGPTARGMDWKDEASQELRFEILAQIGDLRGRSVHEIACGAGHLADFLAARGIDCEYSGSDLSEEMIEAARRRHPEGSFECADVLRSAPARAWDTVLCSGLFHVKLETPEGEWREFVHATLRRMFEMCRVGIAFNLMTDRVDYREPTLHYADPAEILAFCLGELSPRVVVRHDYPLYEFTSYVYRA